MAGGGGEIDSHQEEEMKLSRQIRLIGVAALAVLATSAVAVTSAQAGEFTAAEYPATITGQQINGPHEFTTELGLMGCKPEFHGELAAASSELTITPSYETECSIGGKVVHVDMNGCDYRFHAGNTLAMHVVEGSMDIICPEGNEIDFEITSMPICHLTVPEQLGLGDVTYTNRTMFKDVDLDFDIEDLAYGLDNECPVVGTFENGTYVGESTLKADHEEMGTGFQVD